MLNNSLYSIIQRNAKYYPDNVAFKINNKTITFAEFYNKVEQLSTGISQLNLKNNSHIAILSDNNIEYLIICGVCSKLNIILTLLNCRQSAPEQVAILNKIEPDIFISQDKYQDIADAVTSAYSKMKSIIISEQQSQNNLQNLFNDKEITQPLEIKHDHPFIIIPTAAVDGQAKGAVLSQSNLLNSLQLMSAAYGTEKLGKHLAFLPFYHILGLCGTLATFNQGGTNVIMEKYEPLKAAELIHQEKVTYFGTFPPILEKIIDAAEQENLNLGCLKMVYGIEGPPQINRLKDNYDCGFYVGFGQTETSGFVTAGAFADYPGTAGKIDTMNYVEIMNDNGQILPLGQEGEIVVKGPMVFKEYWKFPTETAYAFRHGWLHTGDLGNIQTGGILTYLGRKPEKALIKTGGENVYPGEIEQVLNQHNSVIDTVVFGTSDDEWGEAVCAAVLLKSEAIKDEKVLTDHLLASVARYKKPKHWFFLKEFPQKEGKVDREQVQSICLKID